MKKVMGVFLVCFLMLLTTACPAVSSGVIKSLNVVGVVVNGLALAEPLMCGTVIPAPVCPLVELATTGAATLIKNLASELATNDTNAVKLATVSGAITQYAVNIDPAAKPYLLPVLQALQAFQAQMTPAQLAKAYAPGGKLTLEQSNELSQMRVRPNMIERYRLRQISKNADQSIAALHGSK